jgi:hypothetical protein
LRIVGLDVAGQRLSLIDAESYERAVTDTHALESLTRPHAGDLELDAYAVARIA